MQNHYLPHQFDLSNIIYDQPEYSDDFSRKTIKIYDKKKDKPLYIQTPELVNLFGVIKKTNYSEILLPLGGIQCLVFKKFISNLENKILQDANLNKYSWFNNKLTGSSQKKSNSEEKTINSKSIKFLPIIKEINKDITSTMDQADEFDRCNDGLIKIKITKNTLIKKESTEITVDELTKNNKLRMILQIYAVWITMKPIDDEDGISTFGIYLKPEIIEEKVLYNLNFIEDDKIIFESDEEEEEDNEEDE
jgi:hypothetical protein